MVLFVIQHVHKNVQTIVKLDVKMGVVILAQYVLLDVQMAAQWLVQTLVQMVQDLIV